MSARNGAAPATDGAVKQGPTIVVAGERDKQLLGPTGAENQDARALKFKRARHWAIVAFREAGARWMPPDARDFADRAPLGCVGVIPTDSAQQRTEAKIEKLRALRLARDFTALPFFLEAAE